MAEAVINQLEQKRFVISPESLGAMKNVRDALPKLQEEFPILSGVSFFGSRTKGTEHTNSDLDIRIFYDTSKAQTLSNTFGGLLPAVPYVNNETKVGLQSKIREASGLNLDEHEGLLVDISKDKTDKNLNIFMKVASPLLNQNPTEKQIDNLMMVPPAQDLFSQFFLAVGEGVYTNRTYILDKFKQTPQGEQYFQLLMKSLARMERASNHKYITPEYEHLPKTIDEAKKYFLTKPQFLKDIDLAA